MKNANKIYNKQKQYVNNYFLSKLNLNIQQKNLTKSSFNKKTNGYLNLKQLTDNN